MFHSNYGIIHISEQLRCILQRHVYNLYALVDRVHIYSPDINSFEAQFIPTVNMVYENVEL